VLRASIRKQISERLLILILEIVRWDMIYLQKVRDMVN